MNLRCHNGQNVSATTECKDFTKNGLSSITNGISLSSLICCLLVFSMITGLTAASAGFKNAGTIMLSLVTMMITSSIVYVFINWNNNQVYMNNCLKTAPKCE